MKGLSFWPVAWSLGLLAAITYVLDVILGLMLPGWWVMQRFWELIIPGFTWLSWGSFLWGLVVAFLSGVYMAVVFVPLYNYFVRRQEASRQPAQEAHPTTG